MKTTSVMKFAVLTAALALSGGAHSATQQITLEAGWNLISLQVVPKDISVVAFAEHFKVKQKVNGEWSTVSALSAIWRYDAKSSQVNKWQTCQCNLPEIPCDLLTVEPGIGYWVKVTDNLQIELEGEPWDGGVELMPGWNLVGFPGLEETKIASVFQDQLSGIDQIWTFEGGSMGRFVGYDMTAVPKRKDLEFIEPGRGYWVYAPTRLTLEPNPAIVLPGDRDNPPLQREKDHDGRQVEHQGRMLWVCGTEDAVADLNGNGIIDDGWTQDTLSFSIGVERQPIVIGNMPDEVTGRTACGSFNWSIEESCDWLSVEGETEGTVSVGNRYVYLKADRADLPAGVYTNNSILVRAGGLEKRIVVIVHVATVAGDFKGYASATKVNGKSIPLGKVDMGLNLFMQSDGVDETRFKAVVDKDSSLLFPRDVFMNGVFYFENNFSLTTSFSMPAADRNAPPYDVFSHVGKDVDPEGMQDKDWNGNGVLDVDNPFPHPLRRSITLFGERRNENTLAGSYIETIEGLLPDEDRICIEGTFSLDRKTFKPSQNSIYNGRDTPDKDVGGTKTSEMVRRIKIEDAVKIQKVKVGLTFDFARYCNLPQNMTVTLESPQGTIVTLFDRSDSLVNQQTLELGDFDGEFGNGEWILKLIWNSPEIARFHSWTLSLGGVATYSVSGRLTDETGKALADAEVTLTGSNEISGQTTDADGRFKFEGLTEDDYALVYSRPGYETAKTRFEIEHQDVVLTVPDSVNPNVQTDPRLVSQGANGLNEIVISPCYGVAPLDVDFVLGYQGKPGETVMGVDWRVVVNDDTKHPVYVTTSAMQSGNSPSWTSVLSHHFDADVAFYEIKAVVRTSNGVCEYPIRRVGLTTGGLSRSSTGGELNLGCLSQCGFIGGGTWPMNGFPCVTSDETNAVEYAQMKRDSATFDINRWPTNRFADVVVNDVSRIIGEDTDFFIPTNTPYFKVAQKAQLATDRDGVEDVKPLPLGGKHFRLVTTLGGWVFGEQPCRADGKVLQCGRIED